MVTLCEIRKRQADVRAEIDALSVSIIGSVRLSLVAVCIAVVASIVNIVLAIWPEILPLIPMVRSNND